MLFTKYFHSFTKHKFIFFGGISSKPNFCKTNFRIDVVFFQLNGNNPTFQTGIHGGIASQGCKVLLIAIRQRIFAQIGHDSFVWDYILPLVLLTHNTEVMRI